MASWELIKSKVTLFPNKVALGGYWGSPFGGWETPHPVWPDLASAVAPLAALPRHPPPLSSPELHLPAHITATEGSPGLQRELAVSAGPQGRDRRCEYHCPAISEASEGRPHPCETTARPNQAPACERKPFPAEHHHLPYSPVPLGTPAASCPPPSGRSSEPHRVIHCSGSRLAAPPPWRNLRAPLE